VGLWGVESWTVKGQSWMWVEEVTREGLPGSRQNHLYLGFSFKVFSQIGPRRSETTSFLGSAKRGSWVPLATNTASWDISLLSLTGRGKRTEDYYRRRIRNKIDEFNHDSRTWIFHSQELGCPGNLGGLEEQTCQRFETHAPVMMKN